jgi:hypothetical protein
MEPQQQQIEEISPSGYKRQINKESLSQSPYKNSASPNKMMQQSPYQQMQSNSRIQNPFIEEPMDGGRMGS